MSESDLTREELLVLVMEECGEVIQAAAKCLRFGFDSDHGVGYGKNDVVLAKEVGDLSAVLVSLRERHFDPVADNAFNDCRRRKMAKARAAKMQYGTSEPRP